MVGSAQRPQPDAENFDGEVSSLNLPLASRHSITSSARGRNDVDRSTPNHLNIPVSERDYNINPRFSVFIGFVLHDYADNDFRIFCARLRPFALNNFRLFDLSEQAPHEYPS
jgi:hypothetical protein